MKFQDSETFKNLSKAFAGESQAHNRYTYYSSSAKNEGYPDIQSKFEETATQEKEHAKTFYKLMIKYTNGETNVIHVDADYPLVYKDTLTNLRAAAAGEREEWMILYSKFGDIAELEGFSDIAVAFHKIAEVKKKHEERLTRLANALDDETLNKKDKTTKWKGSNWIWLGPMGLESKLCKRETERSALEDNSIRNLPSKKKYGGMN